MSGFDRSDQMVSLFIVKKKPFAGKKVIFHLLDTSVVLKHVQEKIPHPPGIIFL